MAAEGETGEKTEEPSARRLSEARSDGQVGKSADVGQVLGLSAAFIGLQYLAPMMWQDIGTVLKVNIDYRRMVDPLTPQAATQYFGEILWVVLPELMIVSLIAGIVGAGSTAFQTNFLWSWKLLQPKFTNINPIDGIKRLFGLNNFVSVFKSLIKLLIICPIGYFAFFDLFPELIDLMDATTPELLEYTGIASAYVFWKITSLLLILALLDLAYQKWNTKRQLKMTKVEVKEERKSIEGDEATKKRIMQIGFQRARDRMMQAVPTADVVVTNPTHLAIALSYQLSNGGAPKVVAKGQGYVAARIREIAKANNVPVVERKPLARALYKVVEVGQEIPFELYQAVAELLAYVYRLKGHRPQGVSPEQEGSNSV